MIKHYWKNGIQHKLKQVIYWNNKFSHYSFNLKK